VTRTAREKKAPTRVPADLTAALKKNKKARSGLKASKANRRFD